MKKKLLLLLFAFALLGCKSDEVPENLDGIDGVSFFANMKLEAPSSIVPKESLPNWLVEKINKYEGYYPNGVGLFFPVRLFKGEWKERTIYYIFVPHSSCMFCELYYKDGEKCTLNDDSDLMSFQTTSKNWMLIYKIGQETNL
jgi:hypothetical protein